jgi:YbbR domain-containing protein
MKLAFLRRNLGYKLFSLALAILLYTVVFAQQRPTTNREVFIQPEVVNVPGDMVVKSGPTGFMAKVMGDAGAVEEFRNKRTKALVDLAQAKPGVNVLEIRYDDKSPRVEVEGPNRSQVVLEKRSRLTFTVDVLFDSSAPPGLVFQEPVVEPSKVVVSGLASEVSKVARVVAIVFNSETSSSYSGTVDIVPQNIRGEAVDSVTLEPAKVTVSIGLRKAPLTKAMVLSAAITGLPAPGYALLSYTFNPPIVTVRGSKELISERSTLEIPVDITGLKETTTRQIRVPLPTGMSLTEPESGVVTLRLEARPVEAVVAPSPPNEGDKPAGNSSPREKPTREKPTGNASPNPNKTSTEKDTE